MVAVFDLKFHSFSHSVCLACSVVEKLCHPCNLWPLLPFYLCSLLTDYFSLLAVRKDSVVKNLC